MSDVRRQDEPSMEEILASIRRIIAEDAEAAPSSNAPAEGQDILELTDRVEADGSVVSIASRRPVTEAPASYFTPAPPRADPAPPVVEAMRAAPAAPETDRLISETAEAASVAALAAFARDLPRQATSEPSPAGDQAIEDITRELLKPLLKSWLDGNLPGLIERVVREEIARLAREARDR
ncbi:MAG TPA: DUF2497 domain-containing protein [Stellaceae bacterium]|nr:DUF2497 domain-containing protein [Stellaceae bacterium]